MMTVAYMTTLEERLKMRQEEDERKRIEALPKIISIEEIQEIQKLRDQYYELQALAEKTRTKCADIDPALDVDSLKTPFQQMYHQIAKRLVLLVQETIDKKDVHLLPTKVLDPTGKQVLESGSSYLYHRGDEEIPFIPAGAWIEIKALGSGETVRKLWPMSEFYDGDGWAPVDLPAKSPTAATHEKLLATIAEDPAKFLVGWGW